VDELSEFLWGALPVPFIVEAGHDDAVDAAGVDVVKWGEALGGDIEGESVHGDPLAHADAHGGDFAPLDPDTGEAFFSSGFDPDLGTGLDEGLLHGAEEGVEVFALADEVGDEIANELSWSVVGCEASAVDLDDRVGEVNWELRLLSTESNGVDGGVF